MCKAMTYRKVYDCFKEFEDEEPTLTSRLITKGYRQKSGGYIADAKKLNIDYITQWNHLMNYCKAKIEKGEGDKPYPYTPCGELLVYMAEKLNAVEKSQLEKLIDTIINSKDIDNRRKWNDEIKKLCWYSIKRKIEKS